MFIVFGDLVWFWPRAKQMDCAPIFGPALGVVALDSSIDLLTNLLVGIA